MKKILIFSDTHGDINRCLDIIEKADSVSAIFHAGDYTGDAVDIPKHTYILCKRQQRLLFKSAVTYACYNRRC